MSNHRVVESFEFQIDWCARLDSRLYAELLTAALRNLANDGVVKDIVGGFTQDAVRAALALRYAGGLHRLVLMGLAPELARHFPSVGGEPDWATLSDDVIETSAIHRGYLTDALTVAPQTNSVGRSAALLPGLMAAVTGSTHDVRLLEIGSSGGLNLFLDRFRYVTDEWSWGDPDSAVLVAPKWWGPAPGLADDVRIQERSGCDIEPLDMTSEEAQLRLLSFVWPDQVERFKRTQGAISIAVAGSSDLRLDAADAPSWIRAQLDEPAPRNTHTVLQQSVMWQYLDANSQRSIAASVAEAGQKATAARPFSYVTYEPAPAGYDGKGLALSVTTWPGGPQTILGRGHPHGAWISWEGR